MKKAVVSFANTPDYLNKMNRLENSLKGNFDGDFISFANEAQIGSAPHSITPYMFKPYAIKKALDMGYDLILWCDSPIVAVKDLKPVFDHIEEHGYLFFDNIGHSVGKWSNDKALKFFNKTREEANDIKMIMACCMGFNFRNLRTSLVFADYHMLAEDLFPGSWGDHRHDQTVMSLLINDYGLRITNGQDTFFAYEQHKGVLPISDSVCLFSR